MINRRGKIKMETVYIAGGCLWGVQHFFDTVPGVQMTEAGRANGTTSSLDGPYDGYAECVKVVYDEKSTSISELMAHLFEIIDPYSLNKQGVDVGKKYRTGLYLSLIHIWWRSRWRRKQYPRWGFVPPEWRG